MKKLIAGPSLGIEKIIKKAEILQDCFGKTKFDKKNALKRMGLSERGGHSSKVFSALEQFNLIEKKANEYVITDLFRRIIKSNNHKDLCEALIESVGKPELYNKLLNEYNGKKLPSSSLLTNILINRYDINPNDAKLITNAFIQSIKYTRIYKNGFVHFPQLITSSNVIKIKAPNVQNEINSGSVQGAFDFLDQLVMDNQLSSETAARQKYALKSIVSALNREDWQSVDVRNINIEDYMNHFRAKKRGKYSHNTYIALKSRMNRTITDYKDFLVTSDKKCIGDNKKNVKLKKEVSMNNEFNLISYPFPLSNKQTATLYLPQILKRADADRILQFIGSLVIN